ncbi:MAG TPA: PIN domain-containing protein [Pyrinomonadaceae bacterium]|jgi:predicted nucleic acid-binding protein
MRALLDTDVVLDHLLGREPFAQAAGELLELNARGTFQGYISAITPVNVFYVARKVLTRDQLGQALEDLLLAVRVCPLTHNALRQALALPFRDYEDAVQHACAAANGLDALVTRNLEDYKHATLPVYSPTDFLSRVKTERP